MAMKYIALPEEETRRLSFYLAMEEYAARHIEDDDDLFFMWQVEPSVIFGRNQLIESEVNTAYCRANSIQMFRRKSGGGCVYADKGNVMLSYITRDENVNFTFNRYINMVALALFHLGVEAQATGRNDILIEGKKVSGNAFYHIPGRSIVHGTLLYDTNMAHMTGALTPSDDKLKSKGVESVRQHIALLKDYVNLGLGEVISSIRQHLCDGELTLNTTDITAIEAIEQEYLTDEFIYGRNPGYTVVRRGRIEGAGEFEIRMEVKNNRLQSMNILGDYFQTGDIDAGIIRRLKGTEITPEAFDNALPSRLDDLILHLEKEPFINLIFNLQQYGKQKNLSL